MAKITFLLLFFAIMMPLIYTGCPEDTCCPIGDDCDRNGALCKPSASKDCKKGTVKTHNWLGSPG